MPACLYVRGRLPAEDKPTVGIVGARSCSGYGRHVAWEYAKVFSSCGVQVVSGMALGIDGESHRGVRPHLPCWAAAQIYVIPGATGIFLKKSR